MKRAEKPLFALFIGWFLIKVLSLYGLKDRGFGRGFGRVPGSALPLVRPGLACR